MKRRESRENSFHVCKNKIGLCFSNCLEEILPCPVMTMMLTSTHGCAIAGQQSAAFQRALEIMQGGGCVALVSEAGTPLVRYRDGRRVWVTGVVCVCVCGPIFFSLPDAPPPSLWQISDPGWLLVSRCHELGVPVSPVPGPCAAIAALRWSHEDKNISPSPPVAPSLLFPAPFPQCTSLLVYFHSHSRHVHSIKEIPGCDSPEIVCAVFFALSCYDDVISICCVYVCDLAYMFMCMSTLPHLCVNCCLACLRFQPAGDLSTL